MSDLMAPMTRAQLAQLFARAAEANLTSGLDINGQAPDEALLDLYTVFREKQKLDGLRIGLLGDLRHAGRAQILARLLGRFDVRLSFVSPAALSMPYDVSEDLRAAGLEVEETNDLAATILKTDVLFLIRLNPAITESKAYARYKDYYRLTAADMLAVGPNLLLLGEWEGVEELLAPQVGRRARYARELAAALAER